MKRSLNVCEVLKNFSQNSAKSSDRIIAARALAAVSELIQIASEFDGYVSADHNDTSLLDRKDMWDRLSAALSRVKGA